MKTETLQGSAPKPGVPVDQAGNAINAADLAAFTFTVHKRSA
jgi:hypothetical protein